ncbi:MAG: hypothetical protein MI923_07970 [Phycisphaerales bacterium]|nr:hypothetical protein [Phycisphaerales bacterium]
MRTVALPLFIATCMVVDYANAQSGTLFVSRPHQVVKLVDLNSDGDYLDFAERTVFADGLPAGLDRITVRGQFLFVGASQSAEVFVLEDRNGDGDAFDSAEVLVYGRLPAVDPAPMLAGLATGADGRVFFADAANGTLHVLRDLNRDGDALDIDEALTVADLLNSPVAVSLRSDGVVLVAQLDFDIPIRILEDRNGDGDFLDFAENLSYSEGIAPGEDLAVLDRQHSFLVRAASGEVVQLRDLTGDNDVLDFSEVILYASGLTAGTVLTTDGANGLYIGAGDPGGTIYFVRDLNADGDALDFGEVVPVADGLDQAGGIVFVPTEQEKCMKGDINADAVVDFDDVIFFVDVLVGNTIPRDFCPSDIDGNGEVNGEDVQALIELLI